MTGAVRDVPPLPGHKPPVPLDFSLRSLTSMFPSIPGITGGAAGPSGGIGEQGNIGPVNIGAVSFKSSSNWLVYAALAVGLIFAVKKWKK